MTTYQPPSGMRGWEQLTLFQPDAISLEMILHISDLGRFLDGGLRVHDALSGDVLHIEALHWEPSQSGIAEAADRFLSAALYWGQAVWSRPAIARGGEIT